MEINGTLVSAHTSLMTAGLDSMGAAELSMRLNERLRTDLPSTLLFDHPSVHSIANSLEVNGGEPGSLDDTPGNKVRCEVRPRGQ